MPQIAMYNSIKEKLFSQLRSDMLSNGLQNADVGRIISRSSDYVSRCLNGRGQFTLLDQYALLKAIKRPVSDMHLIFPEGGVQVKESTPANQADGAFLKQNKKPWMTNQSESPIDQILYFDCRNIASAG